MYRGYELHNTIFNPQDTEVYTDIVCISYTGADKPMSSLFIKLGVNDLSNPECNRALEGLKKIANLNFKFKCTAGCPGELKMCTLGAAFGIGCPPCFELTMVMRPLLGNTERDRSRSIHPGSMQVMDLNA